MLHVTVGHPRTRAMLDLQESAERAGLRFRALRPAGERERIIFIDKYVTFAQILNEPSIRSHDIILFTDAYDTLVIGGANEIGRAFLTSGDDIIFNGETTFWPPATSPDDPLQAYFDNYSDKLCRYLNSGCYIGYAGAIKKMLSECLAWSQEDGDHDDQRLACRFMINAAERHNLKISVDVECKIFGTLGGSLNFYHYSGGSVRNSQTGSWPSVIHANGDKSSIGILSIINSIQRIYPEGIDLLAVKGQRGFLHNTLDKNGFVIHEKPSKDICVAVRVGRDSIILLSADNTSLCSFHPNGHVSTAKWAKNWEKLNIVEEKIFTCHGNDLNNYTQEINTHLRVCEFPLGAFATWTTEHLCRLMVTLSSL
ncbi:glycosyltransferase domain-containing protein [Gluconobacter japonicus]|uniref:glycosyltransferase domain-containing protein n=1 Tax=Gluconobacter japonicus TaxID=376620 RepID=UPI0039EAE76A